MNEADLSLFDRYLSKILTPAEVQQLEDRLAKEPDLKLAFAQYRQQDNYLQYRANGGLMPKELGKLAEESWGEATKAAPNSMSSATRRSLKSRYFGIAAAIALLLLAGWWMMKGEAAISGPDLYASQLVLPRIDNSLRGASDSADSLYQLAVAAYSVGDFVAARPLLDRYLEDHELDSELLLAYAVASLEEDQFVEAEIALRRLEQTSSLLRAEVPFYRALSQLKQGNVAAAKAIIDAVDGGDAKLENLKARLAD